MPSCGFVCIDSFHVPFLRILKEVGALCPFGEGAVKWARVFPPMPGAGWHDGLIDFLRVTVIYLKAWGRF